MGEESLKARPRLFCLGNNWVALQVLQWLKEQREEVVGLGVHTAENRTFAREIIEASELEDAHIFDGSLLSRPDVIQAVRSLQADLAISVYFGSILTQEFIDLFPKGIINLHASYLPFNRGANPNVWSIVDGTPAGVSLHYIDRDVDTGDIIVRREVEVEPVDTGETLYRKLEQASILVFKDTWPLVKGGTAPRLSQAGMEGPRHRVRDVGRIQRIDLDRSYRGRELIDVLRRRPDGSSDRLETRFIRRSGSCRKSAGIWAIRRRSRLGRRQIGIAC